MPKKPKYTSDYELPELERGQRLEIYRNIPGNKKVPGERMPTSWVYFCFYNGDLIYVEDREPNGQAYPIDERRIKRVEFRDKQLSLDELPSLTPGESKARALDLIKQLKEGKTT